MHIIRSETLGETFWCEKSRQQFRQKSYREYRQDSQRDSLRDSFFYAGSFRYLRTLHGDKIVGIFL